MNKSVKTFYKMRFIPLLLVPLLVVMMVLPATLMAAGPTTVDLKTAGNFAVLGASAVNDTATSVVKGDVGLSPAAWLTALTAAEVTGTIYSVDGSGPLPGVTNAGLLTTAKNDSSDAYLNAAGRTPTQTFVAGDDLGGKILTTGVYAFGHATTANLTGTLTLDGQGDSNAVFIFQASSDLVTASSSVVKLIGGAQACHVFWQVSTSAFLGTSTTFVGTIMADQSITDYGGSMVDGRFLVRSAAVTLNDTTIIKSVCAAAAAAAVASSAVYTITASTEGNGSMTLGNGKPAGVFSIASGQSIDYIMKPNEGASIVDVLVNGVSVGAVPYYVFLNVTSNQTIHAIFSVPTTTTAPEETTTTAQETATAETTTTTPAPITTTVTGGQIPKTSTPWYNVLVVGIALTLIGTLGWIIIRKRAR